MAALHSTFLGVPTAVSAPDTPSLTTTVLSSGVLRVDFTPGNSWGNALLWYWTVTLTPSGGGANTIKKIDGAERSVTISGLNTSQTYAASITLTNMAGLTSLAGTVGGTQPTGGGYTLPSAINVSGTPVVIPAGFPNPGLYGSNPDAVGSRIAPNAYSSGQTMSGNVPAVTAGATINGMLINPVITTNQSTGDFSVDGALNVAAAGQTIEDLTVQGNSPGGIPNGTLHGAHAAGLTTVTCIGVQPVGTGAGGSHLPVINVLQPNMDLPHLYYLPRIPSLTVPVNSVTTDTGGINQYYATQGGTTSTSGKASTPGAGVSWPSNVGDSVTDGTVIWQKLPVFATGNAVSIGPLIYQNNLPLTYAHSDGEPIGIMGITSNLSGGGVNVNLPNWNLASSISAGTNSLPVHNVGGTIAVGQTVRIVDINTGLTEVAVVQATSTNAITVQNAITNNYTANTQVNLIADHGDIRQNTTWAAVIDHMTFNGVGLTNIAINGNSPMKISNSIMIGAYYDIYHFSTSTYVYNTVVGISQRSPSAHPDLFQSSVADNHSANSWCVFDHVSLVGYGLHGEILHTAGWWDRATNGPINRVVFTNFWTCGGGPPFGGGAGVVNSVNPGDPSCQGPSNATNLKEAYGFNYGGVISNGRWNFINGQPNIQIQNGASLLGLGVAPPPGAFTWAPNTPVTTGTMTWDRGYVYTATTGGTTGSTMSDGTTYGSIFVAQSSKTSYQPNATVSDNSVTWQLCTQATLQSLAQTRHNNTAVSVGQVWNMTNGSTINAVICVVAGTTASSPPSPLTVTPGTTKPIRSLVVDGSAIWSYYAPSGSLRDTWIEKPAGWFPFDSNGTPVSDFREDLMYWVLDNRTDDAANRVLTLDDAQRNITDWPNVTGTY